MECGAHLRVAALHMRHARETSEMGRTTYSLFPRFQHVPMPFGGRNHLLRLAQIIPFSTRFHPQFHVSIPERAGTASPTWAGSVPSFRERNA
jgi:hypothetical protein